MKHAIKYCIWFRSGLSSVLSLVGIHDDDDDDDDDQYAFTKQDRC
jgi:hypothetical protein